MGIFLSCLRSTTTAKLCYGSPLHAPTRKRRPPPPLEEASPHGHPPALNPLRTFLSAAPQGEQIPEEHNLNHILSASFHEFSSDAIQPHSERTICIHSIINCTP